MALDEEQHQKDPSSSSMSFHPCEVIIQDGAIVCKSAKIGILSSSGPKENIKITLSAGNIFHPKSSLLIRLPDNNNDDDDDESNDSPTEVVIGKDNLFEESSTVVVELSKKGGEGSFVVIQTHNRFAPLSRVTCRTIGSANAFEASCNVHCSKIGDGNVFSPLVTFTNTKDAEEEEEEENTLQEQVFFLLCNASWEQQPEDDSTTTNTTAAKVTRMRPHSHGIQRNTNQITDMLETYKKILLKHHALCDVSSDVAAA